MQGYVRRHETRTEKMRGSGERINKLRDMGRGMCVKGKEMNGERKLVIRYQLFIEQNSEVRPSAQ